MGGDMKFVSGFQLVYCFDGQLTLRSGVQQLHRLPRHRTRLHPLALEASKR